MTSDEQDLERRLERWLAETAKPMPPELLDDVLGEIPHRGAKGRWATLGWLRLRPVAGIALAALVLVAVGLAAGIGPALQQFGGPGRSAQPIQVWDPAADYGIGGTGLNPSPDRYGNPGVWSYLYAPSTSHAPADYSPLSFTATTGGWFNPDFESLAIYHSGVEGSIELSPYYTGTDGTRAAVLGWKSPIAGRVTIEARFDNHQDCPSQPGNGVAVSINRGATTLWSARIQHLEAQATSLVVDVDRATTLYVFIDPVEDSSCDFTTLALRITTQ